MASKQSRTSHHLVVGAHMDSPSAERNKDPIWKVLNAYVLPTVHREGDRFQVLEIAAGAGVHTLYFVENIINTSKIAADVSWHPTDPDSAYRASVEARVKSHHDSNVRSSIVTPVKSITLNGNGAIEDSWNAADQTKFDVVICINMIHISPWEATLGLMKEASRHLKPKTGILFCYGPYLENGTGAVSNLQFEVSLKSRNPDWGVRNVEDVIKVAKQSSLLLEKKIEMPKENTCLIFRKV